MKSKFLIVMGPSGVGKNTIMHALQGIDSRFVQIKPHMTRPLRPGETDRVFLPMETLQEMRKMDEATQINHIYGTYYSVLPKKIIKDELKAGNFPMVDYKIPFVAELAKEFPGSLFCVYILPPSFDAIVEWLSKAGRPADPQRLDEDEKEIDKLDSEYADLIDLRIMNEEGEVRKVAEQIYKSYLASLGPRRKL
jgi:guanylate kinase